MKTQCPHCKVRFNTSDKNAGKQAKCPKCGKGFTIEPCIETPSIVKPAAKTPEPIAPPVKMSKQVEPLAQAAQPVKTPESVFSAAKSESLPEQKPEKIAEQVTPAIKVAEPVEKEKPKSKTLSKILFVYCWIAVRIIAGLLGFLGLVLVIRESAYSTLIATFAAADVFWVCSVLIELTLFYKMWAAIQDGQASVSPSKAVAFLFIPIFNFYWALLMLNGFAEDCNAFMHQRSVQAKELSFVLFLIYAFLFIFEMIITFFMICVFAFIGLIGKAFIIYPVLSWAMFFFMSATGICHFITHILVAIKTCNAVNALSE
ncbi:MAG: hypothetical protein JW804_05290 [Sedimentisphaerales bacterium]|nr:hypothetical protein [Sedimentisphaerales bacterium]